MPTAVFKDRVRETSSTTGLGSITLDGPFTGFQGFIVAGDGAKVPYLIEQGNQWELGWGTFHDGAPDTLDRDTVVASSSGGTVKVNWGAGTKQVRLSPPADSFVNRTGDNTLLGANTFQGVTTLTQQLRATEGIAGSPGYAFGSDTDTGMYRVGADTLGFSCAGNLVLSLHSTGLDTPASFAALRFISDVTVGTAPVTVTSTTLCPNLNADLLDGQHGAHYLSAANITGTVAIGKGGTGITGTPANGQLLIGNGAGYVLANIAGTANQVTVTNTAGGVQLSLPQSIATTSSVQFGRLGLGVGSDLSYSLKTAGDISVGGEIHCFGDITISKADPLYILHDPEFDIYLTLYTFNDNAFLGTATNHDLSFVRGTITDVYATLSSTTWDFKKKVLVPGASGFGATSPHIAGIEDPDTGLYWFGSNELWAVAAGDRVIDFRSTSIQVHKQILSILGTGTAPIHVFSTTLCQNLNSDMCDGQHLGTTATVQFSSLTLGNTGLHLLDTDASHDLIITPGSNLTADRTLTISTGDSGRSITLDGNPTLADWFDQSVKVTASPQFANATLESATPVLTLYPTGLSTSAFTISNVSGTQTVINKVSAAGTALIDFNPKTTDGTSAATFRFFRETNTTGAVSFDIYRGNNTSSRNASISGNGNSFVCAVLGNFGIGATNPSELLEVRGENVGGDSSIALVNTAATGTTVETAELKFALANNLDRIAKIVVKREGTFDSAGTSHTSFRFYNCLAGSPTEQMTILPSGMVGIGTTTPTQARLVVMPGSNANGLFLGQQSATEGGELVLDDATNAYHVDVISGTLRVMRHAGNNGAFQAHVMSINSIGVGIGTNVAESPLHIESTQNRTLRLDFRGGGASASYTWQSFEEDGTEAWRFFGRNDGSGINNSLQIVDASSNEVMTFLQGGNVGIGLANPASKVDILGQAINISNSRVNNAGKSGVMTSTHYSTAEEPVGIFGVGVTSTISELYFGGGFSTVNVPTVMKFFANTSNTSQGNIGTNIRFVIRGDGNCVLGSDSTPGTGATNNLVFAGGSTSPVLGAAAADLVHLAGVDNGAGNREFRVQPESGNYLAYGNNKLRTTGALTINSEGGDLLLWGHGGVSGQISLKSDGIRLGGPLRLAIIGSEPADPVSNTGTLYQKGTNLVIKYNDGGTIRYKYLDLSGTGVTWVHSTTSP
jgi:hypothetical protein